MNKFLYCKENPDHMINYVKKRDNYTGKNHFRKHKNNRD